MNIWKCLWYCDMNCKTKLQMPNVYGLEKRLCIHVIKYANLWRVKSMKQKVWFLCSTWEILFDEIFLSSCTGKALNWTTLWVESPDLDHSMGRKVGVKLPRLSPGGTERPKCWKTKQLLNDSQQGNSFEMMQAIWVNGELDALAQGLMGR